MFPSVSASTVLAVRSSAARSLFTTYVDAVAMKLAVKAALLLRPSAAALDLALWQHTARACGLAGRKAALQGAAFASKVDDIVTCIHSCDAKTKSYSIPLLHLEMLSTATRFAVEHRKPRPRQRVAESQFGNYPHTISLSPWQVYR